MNVGRSKKRRRGGVLPPGTFKTFQAMREREHEREREREAQEAIELAVIRRAWPRLPGDLRDVVLAIVGEFDGNDEGRF